MFSEDCTFYNLLDRYNSNMQIKASNLTEKFTFEEFKAKYGGDDVLPLFLIDEEDQLKIFTVDKKLEPKKNQTIIAFVNRSEVEDDDELRNKKMRDEE